MAEDKIIKVPTAYVSVTIRMPKEIRLYDLQFTPSIILIANEKGQVYHQEAIPIGIKRMIPVPPGKFKISARLGGVTSPEKEIALQPGEISEVDFYFGK